MPTAAAEKMRWWAPVLIVVAGLAAYCGSFSGPFVYDDLGSIPENPSIRHLWPPWGALAPPLGDGRTVEGRPILNLSLALNYAISGTRVWSYHAANVLIHLLAGLVLYGLVRRTWAQALAQPGETGGTRGSWRRKISACGPVLPALSLALLWTVHPLQTEAVTYLIQRAESLMGLFYLLTLYGFVRLAEPAGRPEWGWLSALASLLAAGTKEVAVTLPIMVLFFDRTFFAGSFRQAWRLRRGYYLGLAAAWIFLAVLIAAGGGNRSGSSGLAAGLTWSRYGLTQFVAIGRYLQLAVWPHPLVFDYGFFLVGFARAAPAALLVGLLAGATLWGLVKSPALGMIGFWFFGILAVTSLTPGASEVIVERRMYLPLASVIALVVLGLYAWLGRRAFALVLPLAAVLGGLTARRNVDYRSEDLIWKTSLESYPNNSRAHRSLGAILANRGKLTEALAEYRQAARLDPNSSVVQNDLGTALFQLGQIPDSIVRYREAVRLDPKNYSARFNLANSLAKAGRLAEAVPEYERVVRLRPGSPEARSNLAAAHFDWANSLMREHRPEEAVPHYRQALALQPDFANAHYNLGTALVRLRRLPEAAAEYREALRCAPGFTEARQDLARLEAYLKRVDTP